MVCGPDSINASVTTTTEGLRDSGGEASFLLATGDSTVVSLGDVA